MRFGKGCLVSNVWTLHGFRDCTAEQLVGTLKMLKVMCIRHVSPDVINNSKAFYRGRPDRGDVGFLLLSVMHSLFASFVNKEFGSNVSANIKEKLQDCDMIDGYSSCEKAIASLGARAPDQV